MPARSSAVAGYASKTEAILALHAEGKSSAEIGAVIGSSPNAVVTRLGQLRAQGRMEKSAVEDTRGIWTLEKIEKARRLYARTTELIAEKLQVPPGELLSLVVSGTLPPIGVRQRKAQLVEVAAAAAAPGETPVPPLALAAPDEPDRDDDEAELARLAAEEQDDEEDEFDHGDGRRDGDGAGGAAEPAGAAQVALAPDAAAEPETQAPAQAAAPGPAGDAAGAEAAAPRRYRLTNGAGEYLDMSGAGMTRKRDKAWVGTAPQMEEIFRRRPHLKELDPERVP